MTYLRTVTIVGATGLALLALSEHLLLLLGGAIVCLCGILIGNWGLSHIVWLFLLDCVFGAGNQHRVLGRDDRLMLLRLGQIGGFDLECHCFDCLAALLVFSRLWRLVEN